MKTLKGKDLNLFVRFGGINIKKQKGFGSDTYHAPPASRGVYCMPLIAQEFFLLGSMDKFQPGTLPKEPSNDIINNWEDVDWEKWHKKKRKALSLKRKQFLKIKGNIWHHLGDYVDRNEIIDIKGSWVKTTMSTWRNAFIKMSLTQRYGEKDFSIKSVNNAKLLGWYSNDHCEVFFDEKI